jgi:hypothetical protein
MDKYLPLTKAVVLASFLNMTLNFAYIDGGAVTIETPVAGNPHFVAAWQEDLNALQSRAFGPCIYPESQRLTFDIAASSSSSAVRV